MRAQLVVLVVCLSLALCSGLSASSLKAHKKMAKHHSHHLDLEEDVSQLTSASSKSDGIQLEEEDKLVKLDETVESALNDLGKLNSDFEEVHKDLKHIKNIRDSMGAAHKQPAVAKISKCQDGEDCQDAEQAEKPTQELENNENNEGDIDSIAMLQLKSVFDDMNTAQGDDDVSPTVASRMRSILVQHSAATKKGKDDKGYVIGVSADNSGTTFDVSEDGETIVHPAPKLPEGMVQSNDGSARTNDPELRGVPVPTSKGSPVMNADMPGTKGKGWSAKAGTNSTTEDDVVCVCKRSGAPRGIDRVRCKRHVTSTPMPTPAPKIDGIRQCANGTWPAASGETLVKDVICVYFPATLPAPPPPPTDSNGNPDPEYPPECYDDRNEFVVDSVKKRPADEILLQEGVELCGCGV